MKLCIVGMGASGLLLANHLKHRDYIKEIVIIGSPKVPTIGVGESTTMSFHEMMIDTPDHDEAEFIKESHAAVKYGVYYHNWAKRNFLHGFKITQRSYDTIRNGLEAIEYGKLLVNKDPDVDVHDLIGSEMVRFVNQNQVSLSWRNYHHTYHFDAAKYIQYLTRLANAHHKVKIIYDTVVSCHYRENESIEYLQLESGEKVYGNYFVNTTGESKENIFNDEYESLGDVLLTDKAAVIPLEYTDKREQFHPYTVAQTMKYGWRWITPTWSRIGTGYVFSSKHVSEDQAIDELLEDIGDKTLQPRVVDFRPRYNKNFLKKNSCSIGMANGFLEPLDAPGLSFTTNMINHLDQLLEWNHGKFVMNVYPFPYMCDIRIINEKIRYDYNWWASFILAQYKTSTRNDTQFWEDHKNVYHQTYEDILSQMDELYDLEKNPRFAHNAMMFYFTIAAKDVSWKSNIKEKPFPIKDFKYPTMHHLDWITKYHEL